MTKFVEQLFAVRRQLTKPMLCDEKPGKETCLGQTGKVSIETLHYLHYL